MHATRTPQTAAPAAPPAQPAGAKPSWSAPAVECHRTGAEVTAYAGRVTPWRNR
ncbi:MULTISPECIES: pyrroloquinoline quinone precursor peptide PqqA [Kitasatospora]|uniref:pyrroloquinoline quinone precursor peptide PqqA n=1 Tax=Kitasatospora TaxID=2063 RepID=UPI000C70CF9E|nr:pyrroloquinoline quinone precursor peptide PqqA [Kitasatospora sp. GP30]MDH6142825.1 coenzyme PQQ precursor peptide PqqA [Kitasatospora sp. GP30]